MIIINKIINYYMPKFYLKKTIEVNESSIPLIPRITYMQTHVTKREEQKLWRLEFPDPQMRHS